MQYRGEKSGRWLGCTVETEEGYGTGNYKIKANDESLSPPQFVLLEALLKVTVALSPFKETVHPHTTETIS